MERHRTIDSPLGAITVVADDDGLTALLLPGDERDAPSAPEGGAIADAAALQLGEWFAGERTAFDVVLSPQGTVFQRSVWSALVEVPFGETTSYGAIARAIGRPGASRAVGAANGRNPIPLIIPCHRIVAADGSLGGYSGAGGTALKRRLLDFERGRAPLSA